MNSLKKYLIDYLKKYNTLIHDTASIDDIVGVHHYSKRLQRIVAK